MKIADKSILITGASRGIGRALVEEALRRGAKRVYAGTRGPLSHADPRVTAVKLDVTSAEDIGQAVASIASLDVLVNNAGIAPYDDLSNPEILERTFAVNLFGVLKVTRAFLPLLKCSRGAVVNHLSMVALAALESIENPARRGLGRRLRNVEAAVHVGVDRTQNHPVHPDPIAREQRSERLRQV